MRIRKSWPLLMLALAGCLTEDWATLLVPSDSFNQRPIQRERAAYGPASVEAAARVEGIGRKLLVANPQISLNPTFRTIGSPQPEIFHVGEEELNITEGLVNQCKTEGELAAVLAHELGTIVAEREAIAWPRGKSFDREPPPSVRVGTDYSSSGATADLTHLAELGKYEKEFGAPKTGSKRPADPRVVAKRILVRSGYAEAELDSVTRLLTAAAINPKFETQFRNANPPARQAFSD